MPRKLKETSNVYWTQKQDDAIVRYIACADAVERNKIYEELLYLPLSKLVECIHNRFQFSYITDSSVNRQKLCMAHLLKGLETFDPSKGKAFGYLSISAKNFFVQWNNRCHLEHQRFEPLPTRDDGEEVLSEANGNSESVIDYAEFGKELVAYFKRHPRLIGTKKQKEFIEYLGEALAGKECKNRKELSKLSGINLVTLSHYGKRYKPLYNKLFNQYLEHGCL